MSARLSRFAISLCVSALSVVAAFAVGAIVVVLSGGSALTFLRAYIGGAWGGKTGLIATLSTAVPLAMTGLAVLVPLRAGLFNIGGEGQLYIGGLACFVVASAAAALGFPAALVLALVAGAVGGMLWAAGAVALKLWRSTHEVVSTIMLNYIALLIVAYLVLGPLAKSPGITKTADIPFVARLPMMASAGGFEISWGWVVPVVLSLGFVWVFFFTGWGLEVRAVGENARAARVSGVNAKRRLMQAFLIGGALAGLAGALVVCGRSFYFSPGFAPHYGYMGILVAMLARRSPLAIPFAAVFLGSIAAADTSLQLDAGISRDIIFVIQGVLLLVLAGAGLFEKKMLKKFNL